MYMANQIKSNADLFVKNHNIIFDIKHTKDLVKKRLENCQSKLEEAMSKNLVKIISEYEIVFPGGRYSIMAEKAMLKILEFENKTISFFELSELDPIIVNQILKAYSDFSEDKESPIDKSSQPSITVCYPSENSTLWDYAQKYNFLSQNNL